MKLLTSALIWFALVAPAAAAETMVKVNLGDMRNDKSMAMKLDKSSVKAGQVEFDVKNLSKSKVHEMLVIPVQTRAQKLAYDTKNDTLDELKIKSLGEASDIDPGKAKTLTLALKPGMYELVCNQPGHYRHGMKAEFNVIP